MQDTGVILAIADAPQNISFKALAERQQALTRVILKDPDVESLSSFIGVDGTNLTPNSGRIQINLNRAMSAMQLHRISFAGCSRKWRRSKESPFSCSRCKT